MWSYFTLSFLEMYDSMILYFEEFTENYSKINLNLKPQAMLLPLGTQIPSSGLLETASRLMSEQLEQVRGLNYACPNLPIKEGEWDLKHLVESCIAWQ